MDIYLLEAILNGILLGGVLALLALGLNLIFGVIDVVWIAYADLVMCGMYLIYYLYAEFNWPFLLACVAAIAFVGVLGILVHVMIIAPILARRRSISFSQQAGCCSFCKASPRCFSELIFVTSACGCRSSGLTAFTSARPAYWHLQWRSPAQWRYIFFSREHLSVRLYAQSLRTAT